MRLIDADALLDYLGNDSPWGQFKHMVDNMPTIEPDAIVDDFGRKCPVKGHHDWRMVAIGHNKVGDRIDTYRCSKCGEEFNVKFVT